MNFIYRQKRNRYIQRHGLDRADPVAGILGDYFLFAGDQCYLRNAFLLDHFVVVFAGEKTQGKPDHTCRVTQHPLEGEVGFSGIGRAEYRGHRPFVFGTIHVVETSVVQVLR